MNVSNNNYGKKIIQNGNKGKATKKTIKEKKSQVKKCRGPKCNKETKDGGLYCSDCDYRMACGWGR